MADDAKVNAPDESDKSVTVEFDPATGFSFRPPTTEMKQRGKVTLRPSSDGARWKFVAGGVVGDDGDQFTTAVRRQGTRLVIGNECRRPKRDYPYVVVVELDGRLFTSPAPGADGADGAADRVANGGPPIIQNDPT